ncbi:MAG: helix-turn-helix transcriptional regulator, partial [Lachnospiraceae bacterium]|nr:helix-turn-helix transcriptional regulator [Lachnospiraceae bacterium]
SQPLLSHYEKGIRECGLDFVVKVADYYDVSCDYLLGRTANRSGGKIEIADIPGEDDSVTFIERDKAYTVSAINKKLIINSLNIIFDQLDKINNKGLTAESSAYLMASVYAVFRILYTSNPKNPLGIFSVPEHIYKARIRALLILSESNIENLAAGMPISEYKGLERTKFFELSPEIITEQYSRLSSSLFNLIQNTEAKLYNSNRFI